MESSTQAPPEALTRCNSQPLDEILGKAFPVLDQGFVRLVDYMGDEGAIVQAARVSYGKGTKKVSEDKSLIRYLLRHWHTTPFEMCEVKLHVRVPMDCWRQWIRHRTASVNEYSTRYSEAIDAAQQTPRGEWRKQATSNRQGSDGFFPVEHTPGEESNGFALSVAEANFQRHARELYETRLAAGVAREQARKDLPLSTYTEAYWKIDLKNLLGFLALRMDSHAQKEIRDYATVIGEEIVAKWLPNVWQAFNDYHPLRGAMTFTRLECDVLRALVQDGPSPNNLNHRYFNGTMCEAYNAGWLKLKKDGSGLRRNRERDECAAKLHALGCVVPWEDARLVRQFLEDDDE